MLLFISGILTSGKTTIGKLFVQQQPGWLFKDLDDFYKQDKPTITLSNGKVKHNWDCYEALDLDAVRNYINNIIFV